MDVDTWADGWTPEHEERARGTLDNLLRIDKIHEANDAAIRRLNLGDGSGFRADTLEWPEGPGPDTIFCFGRIKSGRREGELCTIYAGAGTSHPGLGRCWQHGGRTAEGLAEAAWVMAHKFAEALDVSPWEALLWAVRIAAGKVAYIEHKLGEATSDSQFMPPGDGQAGALDGMSPDAATWTGGGANLNWWVKQSEFWHDRLTRVAKLAIDAGVAERLVRQIELEAQLMLRATGLMLDELGIDGEQRERALASMAGNLLALEAGEREDESDRDHQNVVG